MKTINELLEEIRERSDTATADELRDDMLESLADVPFLVAEVQRLRGLCENIHDRLLRGQEDAELLKMLDEANEPALSELPQPPGAARQYVRTKL